MEFHGDWFSACNCFGHTEECTYNPEVDREHRSLDIHGHYEGGGVCQNCRDNTEGINCDRCKPGYYRPFGKNFNETDVCYRKFISLRIFVHVFISVRMSMSLSP
jgi:hypothetical protein